jgi:hypothetical protein
LEGKDHGRRLQGASLESLSSSLRGARWQSLRRRLGGLAARLEQNGDREVQDTHARKPSATRNTFSADEAKLATLWEAHEAGPLVSNEWTEARGSPAASFVLLPLVLPPASATSTVSFALPLYLFAFLVFAVPVSYIFGIVPALLAGRLYSGVLAAMPSPSFRRPIRSCDRALVPSWEVCAAASGSMQLSATFQPQGRMHVGRFWAFASRAALRIRSYYDSGSARSECRRAPPAGGSCQPV